MIYIFDTYYTEYLANTAVVGILNWNSSEASIIHSEITNEINEYESGAFYKRELPCLLSLIKQLTIKPGNDLIVVDGYVQLSDDGKLGLGGYLYEALDKTIPVVGVAKNDFVGLLTKKREVFRGESRKPLFITSAGVDLDEVSDKIVQMEGDFRIPTMLKLVDQNSRLLDQ